MRVCLGGTFDPFHRGHEALIGRALALAGPDGHVFIGLVADEYANRKRDRTVADFDTRKGRLEAWIAQQAGAPQVRIRALTDAHGPSATGDYDAIVVSVETAGTSAEINARRRDAGLQPLEVHAVPYRLADDLLPVNATRVHEGRIDRDGRRLRPVQVAVGSANPVKVEAVRRAFVRFLSEVPLDVYGVRIESGVAEQPFGEATWRGARTRASAAMKAAPPPGDGTDRLPLPDYAVGLEAGLFEDAGSGRLLDVQHCVITDRTGFESHGHGPGFAYPPEVGRQVRHGLQTIEEVVGRLAADPAIGRTRGAVGFLTEDRLDRTRLSESAVEAAFVPRVRRDLYEGHGATDDPAEAALGAFDEEPA